MATETSKTESKAAEAKESKEPPRPAPEINLNKPPLALVKDPQKLEKAFSHCDLEGIYRLKIGRRKGLDIWIVDGAIIRRELFIDFVLGGNDQRYKFIPVGEIWIDNSISVEELEFTIIHEIFEREKMMGGMTYDQAHDLAAQEELKTRIDKSESIDDLRERWFKQQENEKKQTAGKDEKDKESKADPKPGPKNTPPTPGAKS